MTTPVQVLIADNSVPFVSILTDYIQYFTGMSVIGGVNNGASAFEMIAGKKPDVILLDVMLSRMDGIEVMSRIGKIKDYKPVIIIISDIDSQMVVEKVFALGASYFFIKPIEIQKVIFEINETLKAV